MLQNDSHLNCLCVMARLIEALAIYMYYTDRETTRFRTQFITRDINP